MRLEQRHATGDQPHRARHAGGDLASFFKKTAYPCLGRPVTARGGTLRALSEKQRRSVAAVPGMGRVGDLNAMHTHLTPTYTATSLSVPTLHRIKMRPLPDALGFRRLWFQEPPDFAPQATGPARRSYFYLGSNSRLEAALSDASPATPLLIFTTPLR